MDFSVHSLNKMENDLNSALRSVLKNAKVQTVEELNQNVLVKNMNKDPLAKMVEDLVKLMHKNICICKSAAAKIDELKSEKIADQKTLIECQQKQLESVKTTVETEMKFPQLKLSKTQ